MKLWTILLIGSISTWAQAENSADFFETRIRPVLANNCYSCHTDSKLGGLRVDSRVALLAGGKAGPAIVPGRPDESPLIKAGRLGDPKLKTPMGSPRLQDTETSDLPYWVTAT